MRPRRLAALTLTASLTALAGMAGGASAAAPALAQGTSAVSRAAGQVPPPPPPPGGGGYSHTVYSQVHIAGDVTGGGGLTSFIPAQCWLEPRFTGAQSWQRGDPVALTPTGDADEYFWWFAQQEPGLMFGFGHNPGIRPLINKVFKSHQGGSGWWWVPAWLDTGAGWACAQGLVEQMNLNNAFLDYAPPQTGGTDTPGHTMDGQILADLARAALRLPTISVHTNPAPTRGDVNLPIWVWVTYNGKRNPSDTASVPLPGGGVLSATVTTTQPKVTVIPSGSARVYNNCGATGSRYDGDPTAIPRCGVTFLAPSTGGPFTLTVTARWTVTWTDSTGAHGGFASPPWPLPQQTHATLVTVREIQSVNNG